LAREEVPIDQVLRRIEDLIACVYQAVSIIVERLEVLAAAPR
jgi:hypothetical protein